MPLTRRHLPSGCSEQMLDAVARWIAGQLSARHVRAAELHFADLVPSIASYVENSPPVEDVTAAHTERFQDRLRRELPSAVRRAASRGSRLVLQLRRDSAPIARAIKAAHLTPYLPSRAARGGDQ
jgi:hypothetical protein